MKKRNLIILSILMIAASVVILVLADNFRSKNTEFALSFFAGMLSVVGIVVFSKQVFLKKE